MDQVIRTAPRLHPLVAAAAVSVIAVSAAGIGVITGVIPGSHAGNSPVATSMGSAGPAVNVSQVAPTQAVAASAPMVSAPVAVVEQPAPRAASKPRVVKVAAAERIREDYAPARTNTLPTVNQDPVRHEAPEPYPSGTGVSGYGQASIPGYGSAPVQVTQAPVAKPVCASCGVVETVIETEKPGDGSGVGIAGGALGGAVIGKQFGNGRGQDALTILGAIGGAIAGHQVEKKVRATKVYEVRVRMEDGSIRSVNQTTAPSWRSGDRVRLEGGNISLNT